MSSLLSTLLLSTVIAAGSGESTRRHEPTAVGTSPALQASPGTSPPSDAAIRTAATPDPGALEPFRAVLIALAADIAGAIPVDPHVKDRSRMQEAAANALIELGHPRLAIPLITGIEGWRRGTAWASVALHLVPTAERTEIDALLERAARVADSMEDWRRDRVRARVAQVLARLDESVHVGTDVTGAGRPRRAAAVTADILAFDGLVDALETIATAGGFDILRGAMESCIRYIDRFHDDRARRDRAVSRIRETWSGLPIQVRIELLLSIAEVALRHRDPASALAILDDAERILDSCEWLPEHRLRIAAPIAALRSRAGDIDRARSLAEELHATYRAQRMTIVDIHRTGALLPLAEAFRTMGDADAALGIYRTAVQEALVNPNSRPRAIDLAATCISMARSGTEPDAELLEEIRMHAEGLGHPW